MKPFLQKRGSHSTYVKDWLLSKKDIRYTINKIRKDKGNRKTVLNFLAEVDDMPKSSRRTEKQKFKKDLEKELENND